MDGIVLGPDLRGKSLCAVFNEHNFFCMQGTLNDTQRFQYNKHALRIHLTSSVKNPLLLLEI